MTASDSHALHEAAGLPSALPRPEGERERLEAVWRSPRGWRVVTEVNNTVIGYFYIATAFLFFLLAGILGLLIRLQLAVPGNDFLSPQTYNQIFTMHGTVMMFLFAVPAVEAVGILLLPQMLGARDLPFPRLGAFAFWAYFVGGLVFFCTLFFGTAPDGGWFMYPPLTGERFSPGIGADWWLLGIGFIEISAIAGAIEIIVGVLRTRAPGMTLTKMPIFAWTLLIFAGMIVFAFPAVILATILLELERAFGWPFFIAEKGGDPLLWQHLFWFFGHPEVYIIFLPAAGMVSMIVPTMARVPLVGYRLIVVALIAVGFFSFGLWVHHMFTTGIPARSLGFFSAASMAVAIPSGIQVFAWIATIAAGRLRITVPSLFVIGFLIIFTLGGLTGVMVAMVPFDRQAHDSYFVVAHLHYVLFGGMVFPLFAAIYYWAPAFSRRPLSERLGRWSFGLIFLGFNIAFLPMHVTGLIGMPRRVYTYPAGMGWDTLNLVSTLGAFMLAAGILVFLVDVISNIRLTTAEPAGNVWDAGSLEWLPNHAFGTRSIPRIDSREPLWDRSSLVREVEAGAHYLPRTATGGRETIVTSPVEAEPQYVMRLTGPGYAHFAAAVFTAGFFLLLTVKAVVLAGLCGIGAIVAIMRWMWECDQAPAGEIDIGGGIRLPSYASGPVSHSWWAMVVLMLVAAALYLSYLFGYLYLWTVAPQFWPGRAQLPALSALLVPMAWLFVSGLLLEASRRLLDGGTNRHGAIAALLLLGTIALVGALGVDVLQHWRVGLRPQASGYAAMVYANAALQAQIAGAVLLTAGFAAARLATGRVDRIRRIVFDNLVLLWAYSLGQAAFGLLLTHGFPRLVAG
ncbi:cytochrome c oxidase subunit I+III [Bosea sp. BE271]|uniref:cytochrome c oxidase subunit I n=1 Tax=Bosea TaxID=85413 RepID=UPI00285A0A50|nr:MULTISPECIES: cytochrome c oxidase subunit I [Bosea]MDR6830956.1 cytochrome c oxidase subunit I+III [Bosea robiniae]MDR6897331.1 cytochrome c oxidase subunit I+III [Bosea sp. BE109]MDR7140728.1 cytochrome c oxidase subunit I+III [Bosea sp. BE168]MDR7177820.1 cytochrome c oxidase subunit I+III [Bosea sp. BE271]